MQESFRSIRDNLIASAIWAILASIAGGVLPKFLDYPVQLWHLVILLLATFSTALFFLYFKRKYRKVYAFEKGDEYINRAKELNKLEYIQPVKLNISPKEKTTNHFEVVNRYGDFKPTYTKPERTDVSSLFKPRIEKLKGTPLVESLPRPKKKKAEIPPTLPKISLKLRKPFNTERGGKKVRVVGVDVTNESDESTEIVKIMVMNIQQTHYHSDTPFTLEPFSTPYLDKGFPLEAGKTIFSTVAAQSIDEPQKMELATFLPKIIPIKYGLTVYSFELDVIVISKLGSKTYESKRCALYLNEQGLLELKEIEAE